MREIIVLVDRSSHSATRVRKAAELARRSRANLALLAPVAATPSVFTWSAPLALPVSAEALRRECEQEAERLLSSCARAVPGDVQVETRTRRGGQLAALLREARDREADLVVLGTSPSWR